MNTNEEASNIRELLLNEENQDKNPGMIYKLRNLIDRLKLMSKLHFSTQNLLKEISSISQLNAFLIDQLVKIFKSIRQKKKSKNNGEIQSQIDYCNKTLEMFQIKIIDSVERLVKYFPQVGNEQESVQSLYQSFFIECSQYMNRSYEHSNKICLLLSQEVHSMSPNHKSVPQPQSSTKDSHSADYFLLKHLFEKTSSAKKMYEQQIQAYEKQRSQLNKRIDENQAEISNLINERDEMKEDLNQLEELIQSGSIQAAKQIIGKKNRTKNEEYSQTIDIIQDFENGRKVSKISQLEQQIMKSKNENECLRIEIETFSQKLRQYKNQIYRAGWIISVQHRQISLNQKIKQTEESSLKRSPFSSDVSFNPGKSIWTQQNALKWPSPQSLFTNVNFPKNNMNMYFQK